MHSITRAVIEKLHSPLSPKSFCLLSLSFVLCSLVGVGAINWLVNPYGQYGSRLMAPIVQDSRREKVELFEKLAFVPDGLILGSSRALKVEPAYLQSRTGQTFFNFAVNHGRPEDFLAIMRYYQQRFHRLPKTVLIGVDIAALDDKVPNDARLCSERRLFDLARDTCSWSEDFDRFSQLFSFQQLSSSFKSLRHHLCPRQRAEAQQAFQADGVIEYIQREREIALGEYDFESALEFNQREFLSAFSRLTEPSQRRLGYLRESLRLCKENGCKVYLFATVSHPRLRDALAIKTKFLSLEKKSLIDLEAMANEMGAKFMDFGRIESFAGDPASFVDGIHPLEPNTRRMVDRLLSRPSEGSYAFQ